MGRWAVLLHELPDKSWHYDWVIQSSDSDRQQPLVTFRTAVRPDDPAALTFSAQRLADHRPEYLEYEGAVSGARGTVRRLAAGEAAVSRDDAAFVVTLDGGRTWVGKRVGFEGPRYQFHLSQGGGIGHTDGAGGVGGGGGEG